VREITSGRGVDVAYDSVGKDTFQGSLESLALRGHLVNFGQASGAVEPLEIAKLAARSNSVTRPILFHYTAVRKDLERMAQPYSMPSPEAWLQSSPARSFLSPQPRPRMKSWRHARRPALFYSCPKCPSGNFPSR
jgi:NADPH:quinone reductase